MGLRRPPQPSRLRSPTARQLLTSFLVYVSVDTRNKMPRNRQEIHKQNCEQGMGEKRREEKRRGSNGDGKLRRVQIEDLSVALSPFCPRAWSTNHPSATAPPFPKLPPARGVASLVITGRITGAFTYLLARRSERYVRPPLLHCKTAGGGSVSKQSENGVAETYPDRWAWHPSAHHVSDRHNR